MKKKHWRKYGIEFLSIFIAVIAAFALNNWSENRRDKEAATKILAEISNGLEKDIEDVRVNKKGHDYGILACKFWQNIVAGKEVSCIDSLPYHYYALTRDYVSIQNVSGYESLKSKGLELIEDDSLRFDIINIYEYDYTVLKKLEEEYNEMQYYKNYFDKINQSVAPHFKFDDKGSVIGINLPLKISEEEKKIVLSYLWRIHINRNYILRVYNGMEEKIIKLREKIERNLK